MFNIARIYELLGNFWLWRAERLSAKETTARQRARRLLGLSVRPAGDLFDRRDEEGR